MTDNDIVMTEVIRLAEDVTGFKVERQDFLASHGIDDTDIQLTIKVGFMEFGCFINDGDIVMTCDRNIIKKISMSDPNLFDKVSESIKGLKRWGR